MKAQDSEEQIKKVLDETVALKTRSLALNWKIKDTGVVSLNDLEELEKVMKEWIFKKPKEHHFEEEHSSTVMNEIGG